MYSVVLADDEKWILEKLERMVDWESLGFVIKRKVSCCKEAWDAVIETNPDIVFADIQMPDGSGLSLIETARSHGLNTEFIIVSGYDEFEYARRAISAGVFYYFLKPVGREELENVLKRLSRKLSEKERNDNPVHTGNNILNDMVCYISENYTEQISLKSLEERFHISTTYICDLFRDHLNTTFVKYLNGVRLERAAYALRACDLPVSTVAAECGYSSYSYFSEAFRRKYHMTPTEYRKG